MPDYKYTDPEPAKKYSSAEDYPVIVKAAIKEMHRQVGDLVMDHDGTALQKPNAIQGLFDDVIDTGRLTGTIRYLFADPAVAPALEVAFLDGEQQPYMEMKDGWRVDGAEWKVRHDFGVTAVDYRSALIDAGA